MECRHLPGATRGQILASLLPAGGEVGGIEDQAMAGAKPDRQTECAVLQTIEPTSSGGIAASVFLEDQVKDGLPVSLPRSGEIGKNSV
jgi:hypothetical protein